MQKLCRKHIEMHPGFIYRVLPVIRAAPGRRTTPPRGSRWPPGQLGCDVAGIDLDISTAGRHLHGGCWAWPWRWCRRRSSSLSKSSGVAAAAAAADRRQSASHLPTSLFGLMGRLRCQRRQDARHPACRHHGPHLLGGAGFKTSRIRRWWQPCRDWHRRPASRIALPQPQVGHRRGCLLCSD